MEVPFEEDAWNTGKNMTGYQREMGVWENMLTEMCGGEICC